MTAEVTLIASTWFSIEEAVAATGYVSQFERLQEIENKTGEWHHNEYPNAPDELAEFAGRNCYQAWERKNPATMTNAGYLHNIISQGHFSVMEHASATFVLSGVSTALLGQLTRHRHLSFSVLSKRYVDESNSKMVTHPGVEEHLLDEVDDAFGVISLDDLLEEIHDASTTAYSRLVEHLVKKGKTRKEAREIARGVLPQATETVIVVTGNMRAWRDVLSKRNHQAADAEIRDVAVEILRQLKELAPNCFQDIIPWNEEEPYAGRHRA